MSRDANSRSCPSTLSAISPTSADSRSSAATALARARSSSSGSSERTSASLTGTNTSAGNRSKSLPYHPSSPRRPQAGECAVAYRADPILCLPIPTSLDGNACVERVMDGVAKQLMRGGWRLVRLFVCLPEEQPECGTTRAEVGRSRERQIKLKAVREQEHPVDDRTAREVEQLNRPELANDGLGPGFQHFGHRHLVCDGEHEVEIRPPVPFVVCERANHSPSDDRRVRRRDVQHPVAHVVTMANVEHDAILNPEASLSPPPRSNIPTGSPAGVDAYVSQGLNSGLLATVPPRGHYARPRGGARWRCISASRQKG